MGGFFDAATFVLKIFVLTTLVQPSIKTTFVPDKSATSNKNDFCAKIWVGSIMSKSDMPSVFDVFAHLTAKTSNADSRNVVKVYFRQSK